MNKDAIQILNKTGRCFIVLLALMAFLPAYAWADEVKVKLSFQDAALPVILKEIKQQTGYDFMYNAQEIDVKKKRFPWN